MCNYAYVSLYISDIIISLPLPCYTAPLTLSYIALLFSLALRVPAGGTIRLTLLVQHIISSTV